jgi:hypothetical protein
MSMSARFRPGAAIHATPAIDNLGDRYERSRARWRTRERIDPSARS